MIEKSSPEFADLLGEAIVSLSRYFCGVPYVHAPPGGVANGRTKLDPVYRQVTEGRDGPGPEQWRHYSSCGDQLHAILERVGVRLPFLNRKSLHGWVPGANISRLQRPACPFAAAPLAASTYRPPNGSLCLIWKTGTDAHALVILGPGSDEHHIETGNYGAGGMSPSSSPGANIADSPWAPELSVDGKMNTGHLLGSSRRKLHTVITPASIVPYIEAQINLSGCAVTGELVDALGARYE